MEAPRPLQAVLGQAPERLATAPAEASAERRMQGRRGSGRKPKLRILQTRRDCGVPNGKALGARARQT